MILNNPTNRIICIINTRCPVAGGVSSKVDEMPQSFTNRSSSLSSQPQSAIFLTVGCWPGKPTVNQKPLDRGYHWLAIQGLGTGGRSGEASATVGYISMILST